MDELNELQKIAGYKFKNPNLLISATIHSSLAVKNNKSIERSFDRLEFLGDRVLNLIVAQKLYEGYEDCSEGELAKRYAAIVNFETCDKVAKKIGLDKFLKVAKNTILDASILCDALEALLGAIYLDGGLEPCEVFIKKEFHEFLENDIKIPQEAKSLLQEMTQKISQNLPLYETKGKTGTEHEPVYIVSVTASGLGSAIGKGNSKKNAEKDAALNLLKQNNIQI